MEMGMGEPVKVVYWPAGSDGGLPHALFLELKKLFTEDELEGWYCDEFENPHRYITPFPNYTWRLSCGAAFPRHDRRLVKLVEDYIKRHEECRIEVKTLRGNKYYIWTCCEYGYEEVYEPDDYVWIEV
jgi:hypothetical protein